MLQDIKFENKIKRKERNKGKSLIEFVDNYTVIDIETTGLSPFYNEIIELCAIRVRNNRIVDKFTTLIKPDKAINSFTANLTGITNEMLKNAPKIEEILDKYLSFTGKDILVGHNVNFDINFIFDNCFKHYKIEFCNDFIDTRRLSKKLCPIKRHRLDDLAEYYKINVTGHHRAENDCIITNAIYQKMKLEALSRYDSVKENCNIV